VAEGMQAFAQRTRPQFVISTGDNLYPNGVTTVDDPRFRTVFEEVYSGADLQVPWHLALGNHDHLGDVESQIAYSSRSKRWRIPAPYYKFTESSDGVTADFFVLDTETLVTRADQTQLEWLDGELTASSADWKICVGHHPIRSCGHYGGTPALVQDLKPLLDHHGVVAYLCGHDHDVQLLKSPEDRFVCLVSGGGGKARDARYGDDTLFARTNGGFAAMTLSKTEMTAAVLDPDGHVDFVEHCLCVEDRLARR
jgi:acid phosphatase